MFYESEYWGVTLEQINRLGIVKELLKHNVKNHHVMFREGTRANHVSHALIALSNLNAPENRLKEFYQYYIRQLDESLFRRGWKHEEINNIEFKIGQNFHFDLNKEFELISSNLDLKEQKLLKADFEFFLNV